MPLAHIAIAPSTRATMKVKKLLRTNSQQSSPLPRLTLAVFAGFIICITCLLREYRPCKNETSDDIRDALPTRRDWDTPPFCKALKNFPQPFDRNCALANQTAKGQPKRPACNPNRPQFFSQFGEDYFLYTRHFRYMRRPGVYFDVATNDPVIISNTYFLDRCLGWRGACVEANQKYHEPIHRKRSCHLVPTCVSEADGVTVRFALHGPSGGILETHKMAHHEAVRNATVDKKRCTDMKTITRRFDVTYVDYLNVDVEGHEMQVLNGWDWENVKVGIATIELNAWNKKPVKKLMTEQGFKELKSAELGFHMTDPVWVHESVMFGQPK